jgi:hypothetical protein
MPWYHNRWNLCRVGIVLFFTFAGLLAPMDSPPLSPGLIVGVFFVFPFLFVPPVLVLRLNHLCRRPNPPSLNSLRFLQSGGLAFVCFGITALLRSIILKEPLGVQFMPLGFGLAISIGMVVFHRMQNEHRPG